MAEKIELSNDEYLYSLYILITLSKQPSLRFSEIQDEVNLSGNRLNRIIEFLYKNFWIIPRVVPERGRILAEYELTKRGKLLVDSLILHIKTSKK
jgi:DNA-binding HxlR family transcriptional regulator